GNRGYGNPAQQPSWPRSQGGAVTTERWTHLICIGMSVLFGGVNLSAQEATGAISGVIVDSSGATVPGAVIEAQNAGTNLSRRTETNARGEYTIPALQPGLYNLTVTKDRFKKAVYSNIELQVNRSEERRVGKEGR